MIHLENLHPLSGRQKLAYVRERLDNLILRLSRNPLLVGFFHKTGSLTKRAVTYSRGARFSYNPAPYSGTLTLFRASERPWYMTWDPMESWPKYISGDIQIQPVPGRHDSILFEPHVKDLAAAIDRRIEQVINSTG